MDRIIFPITPGMQNEDVANLQDGLRLLLDQGVFPLSDAERQVFEQSLEGERTRSYYGQATRDLVRLFQEQRPLEPSGEVDEPTADALNAVLEELGAFSPEGPDEQPPFVVRGQVRQPDGSPIIGAIVRAYDKDLRTEELLGEVHTDPTGHYEIQYTVKQFRRAEKRRADLRVRVYLDGEENPTESEIIFNAQPVEIVDFSVGGEFRGPSEYDELIRTLTPLLQDVPLHELIEEDVSFLASDTGLDPQRIAWLVESVRRHQNADDIPAQIFYGLFRWNLPTEMDALLDEGMDVLRRALEAAIEENIIPANTGEYVDRALQHLYQLSIVRELEPSDNSTRPSLQDRYGDLFDEGKLRALAEVNAERPFLSEEWEDSLRERGFEGNDVEHIRTGYALGALTQNNLSLYLLNKPG